MSNRAGTHGERVRTSILTTGLDLWRKEPTKPVAARKIADALGMTHGGVLYHFKSADALRIALADEAVRQRDPVLVVVLIATKHPSADGLTGAERRKILGDC